MYARPNIKKEYLWVINILAFLKEEVAEFLALGLSKAEIARKLGRHRSSIGRKIQRNSHDEKYSPHKAQETYNSWKKMCGTRRKLENNIILIYIQEKLEKGWTPEQAGHIKLKNFFNISFQTIYSVIKNGILLENSISFLPRKGRKNGAREKRIKSGVYVTKEMLKLENAPRRILWRNTLLHLIW